MILAVKGSRFRPLFKAGSMIMGRQVIFAGIKLVAVHASRLTGSLISYNLSNGCAEPLLERQMKTLLVSRPDTL